MKKKICQTVFFTNDTELVYLHQRTLAIHPVSQPTSKQVFNQPTIGKENPPTYQTTKTAQQPNLHQAAMNHVKNTRQT